VLKEKWVFYSGAVSTCERVDDAIGSQARVLADPTDKHNFCDEPVSYADQWAPLFELFSLLINVIFFSRELFNQRVYMIQNVDFIRWQSFDKNACS